MIEDLIAKYLLCFSCRNLADIRIHLNESRLNCISNLLGQHRNEIKIYPYTCGPICDLEGDFNISYVCRI